jgi:hypothetical protein
VEQRELWRFLLSKKALDTSVKFGGSQNNFNAK